MADALASGKKPESGRGGEDAFVKSITNLATWTGKNLRVVIVGLGGLAIVVL